MRKAERTGEKEGRKKREREYRRKGKGRVEGVEGRLKEREGGRRREG